MSLAQEIRRRWRALFGKRRLDLEMDEEMRAHVEMRAQANVEAGMGSEEARREALGNFGPTESVKEMCRDQRGVRWIEDFGQDVRYGLRQLWGSPGFTAIT